MSVASWASDVYDIAPMDNFYGSGAMMQPGFNQGFQNNTFVNDNNYNYNMGAMSVGVGNGMAMGMGMGMGSNNMGMGMGSNNMGMGNNNMGMAMGMGMGNNNMGMMSGSNLSRSFTIVKDSNNFGNEYFGNGNMGSSNNNNFGLPVNNMMMGGGMMRNMGAPAEVFDFRGLGGGGQSMQFTSPMTRQMSMGSVPSFNANNFYQSGSMSVAGDISGIGPMVFPGVGTSPVLSRSLSTGNFTDFNDNSFNADQGGFSDSYPPVNGMPVPVAPASDSVPPPEVANLSHSNSAEDELQALERFVPGGLPPGSRIISARPISKSEAAQRSFGGGAGSNVVKSMGETGRNQYEEMAAVEDQQSRGGTLQALYGQAPTAEQMMNYATQQEYDPLPAQYSTQQSIDINQHYATRQSASSPVQMQHQAAARPAEEQQQQQQQQQQKPDIRGVGITFGQESDSRTGMYRVFVGKIRGGSSAALVRRTRDVFPPVGSWCQEDVDSWDRTSRHFLGFLHHGGI